MNTNDHLQHLIGLRAALLRQVARLDVAIRKDSSHAQGSASSLDRGPHTGRELF